MSIYLDVKPDMLRNLIGFNCPFRVYADGSVTNNVPNVYAPELYDDEIMSDEWEFASYGYTGQYGYRGPMMHNSEFLGAAWLATF